VVNVFSQFVKQKNKLFFLDGPFKRDNILAHFIRLVTVFKLGTLFGRLFKKHVKVLQGDFVIDEATIDDELHEL
jgi:phage FluMu gp28-like protein